MDNKISCYLTGLAHMASSLSKSIGPSFFEIDCYHLKDFPNQFLSFYNISDLSLELETTSYSFSDVCQFVLGDEKELLDSFQYWIHNELGDAEVVYQAKNHTILKDRLSRGSGGCSSFYFVEDVFFIKYKKYMLCLLVGNNE